MESTPSIGGPVDLDFADFEREILDYNSGNHEIQDSNMQASSATFTKDADADDDSLFGRSPKDSPAIPLTESDKDLAKTLAWFQSAEQEQFRSLKASNHENVVALPSQLDTQSHPSPTIDGSDRPQTSQSRTIHANTRMGSETLNDASPRQSHRSTPQSQQSHSQRHGRAPFQDVRQAREWLFDPRMELAQAVIKRDGTIPHGLLEGQQKREAANKLRTAFEGAQPVKSDNEFHMLDAMCLELVQDTTLFHLFGPLTTLYTSGKSKIGTATFDTFDDHVDTIAQVLGTQACPKAKSVRKRLIDATYRKRLIDNPVDEIGLVKKNKEVNEARQLKMEETKAKGARTEELERELTRLKSQMTVRPRSKHGLVASMSEDEVSTSEQQPPAPRRTVTPRRQSSKLLGGEKTFMMQDAPDSYPKAPVSAADYLRHGFDASVFPATPQSDVAGPYCPTLTDTHGPSPAKKPRYGEYTITTRPSTPAPHRSTAVCKQRQQMRSARASTEISQGHQTRQVSDQAASNEARAGGGTKEVPIEYAQRHTTQHQLQESWTWFQTGQITQQAHQEKVAHPDQIDTAAAESGPTSSNYFSPTESSLSATATSGTASLDFVDTPGIDMMTAEELVHLFDLQG